MSAERSRKVLRVAADFAGYLYLLPFFGLSLGQPVVGAFGSLARVWTGERMYLGVLRPRI
jgi:hypothetical protein